jgi:hypothetical protein
MVRYLHLSTMLEQLGFRGVGGNCQSFAFSDSPVNGRPRSGFERRLFIDSVEKLGTSETAQKMLQFSRARVLLDGTWPGIFYVTTLS